LSNGSEPALRVLAVPVHCRGETSGVLSLFLDDGAMDLTMAPGLAELLTALGDVLGLAMENALLSEADFHAGLMLQRHLIANEVHDSLAQNLAAIRMRTALLRDAVAKRDAARAQDYLAEIDESLAHAQSRVREIITDFRSQMGATQLVPALEHAIDELRAASGIAIEFDNGAREPSLSAFEQVQVFYIAREALTNALKHAGARCVRVALAEVGEDIELRVEDDGIGLDGNKSAGHGHFGLNIMHERAARLGGAVAFERRPGGGTRVQLRFPSRMAGQEAMN
jgi:nitrate/nitrite-specific signal transduction histidine kinase